MSEEEKIENESEALFKIKRLLQKDVQKAEENLKKCLGWSAIFHEAELLKAHFQKIKKGMDHILVEDWEANGEIVKIHLNPKLGSQEQIAKRYKQSKRLKRGIEAAEAYLRKSESKLQDWLSDSEENDNADSSLKPAPHFTLRKKSLPEKRVPYREFRQDSPTPIWVGKTAKENDILTFQLAKGTDWWLHASGCPGSHVVIRVEKGKEPSPDIVEDALQLALYYSKAKNEGKGEVIITQQKNVRPAGDAPGKVFVTKERFLKRVSLKQERIKTLLTQKNNE